MPDGATVVLAAHGVSPEVRGQAAARPGPVGHRRHLPARGQGPPRGPALRLPGPAHRARRPRRPRGGGRHDGRGARRDRPRRGRRRRGTPALRSRHPGRLSDPDHARRRRDGRGRRGAAGSLSHAWSVRAPTTSATPARTVRTRCASLAGHCDLVLVVGSANSSNTARLVEVARREGCRAELVEDAGELDLALAGRCRGGRRHRRGLGPRVAGRTSSSRPWAASVPPKSPNTEPSKNPSASPSPNRCANANSHATEPPDRGPPAPATS